MEAELSKPEDDLRRKRLWRLSPNQVEILRETAKKFEGTHNFHNFTLGRDFSDRSNQRHMKKIEVHVHRFPAIPVTYSVLV
jgi:tRNA pseudouridine38-40 synthase